MGEDSADSPETSQGGKPGKAAPATSSSSGTDSPPPDQASKPARGPEHAVYSLVDNRLSAHVQRAGGVVVLGGSAGFVKYLRFRKSNLPWKLRQTTDGKKVAIMGGKTASLFVPLTAEQAADGTSLRMRVYNDRDKALTLRINGQKDREHTQQMAAGWSTVTVPLPGGSVQAGENEIIIFTGAGEPMSLEWLSIGPGELAGDDAPSFYDTATQSLVLPQGGGLAYFVMVPENGRLLGDVSGAGCQVEVRATAQNGKSVTGQLTGRGGAVEMSALSGQPIRLELTGQGCDSAQLENAALAVPGEAPTVKRGEPPKYVILWIMDSLRADRVRPFNPKARPEAPTFERLAKTGTVFAQNYVQGNESRVSHASIMSALYPVKHDMLSDKAKLAASWTTLDEVAKQAGMYVAGVGANGYMDPKWGMGTAWNKFQNHIHAKLGLKGQDVYDEAIKVVDGKKDPWFLYIGTIDTHVSWRPKEPWISKYHAPGYKGRFASRFSGGDAENGLKLTDAEIAWVRAMYDSNVSYQDDLLRQLLEKLEAWGIADQTMLVITADHGDEQWEHERVGHGGSIRETLVHTPLLIHYPPLFPGRRVEEGTEVVDILPTIADALGKDVDPEWQGQSLIPLAQGVGAGYPLMSMASQYEGAHAARMGAWKMRSPGSSAPELYRVDIDPSESKDIAGQNPIALRVLADPLWLLRANNLAWKKSEFGNAANVTEAFPASFGE